MTTAEAKALLVWHSGLNDDSRLPHITQESCDEVLQALRVLTPQLQAADAVDKQVMRALWRICWSDRRKQPLEIEIGFLSDIVLMLLEGEDVEGIFKRHLSRTSS